MYLLIFAPIILAVLYSIYIMLWLQKQPSGNQKMLEIAERIRNKIATFPFCRDDVSIDLTASIGISTLLPQQCDGEIESIAKNFVGQADQALYTAKNNGRNRTVCYADISGSQ